jgi:hypothetical protein
MLTQKRFVFGLWALVLCGFFYWNLGYTTLRGSGSTNIVGSGTKEKIKSVSFADNENTTRFDHMRGTVRDASNYDDWMFRVYLNRPSNDIVRVTRWIVPPLYNSLSIYTLPAAEGVSYAQFSSKMNWNALNEYFFFDFEAVSGNVTTLNLTHKTAYTISGTSCYTVGASPFELADGASSSTNITSSTDEKFICFERRGKFGTDTSVWQTPCTRVRCYCQTSSGSTCLMAACDNGARCS